MVVEDVFRRRGMSVLSQSRAAAAKRTAEGVEVALVDGSAVRGSHCLLTVGMVPSTTGSPGSATVLGRNRSKAPYGQFTSSARD